MEIGLSDQQRCIVRRARRKGLLRAWHWVVRPPLWWIVLATLLPLLLNHHGRYLSPLLIPPLGFWQRQRVESRIAHWALQLRQL
ncbi:MAG: hypothetical protein ACKOXO_08135 [Cyanobium sp.]